MKFGQFIEYNKISILLLKSCRKRGWETSSRPLYVFKKHKVKVTSLQLGFTIF